MSSPTEAYSPHAQRILQILAAMGRPATERTCVLDFGCGAGQLVYELRDAGFDAHGFDMHDYLELRDDADRRFFKITPARRSTNTADFRVDQSSYALPYDDNTFDVVMSSTVLEHLQEYDLTFSEIARVTKSNGVGIHTYPAKFSLLETHIHVPLATIIQTWWWFRLWAALGIRNEFQHDKTACEVADLNYNYARTGLSYVNPATMLKIVRRYFSTAEYRPDLWHYGGRLEKALRLIWPLRHIYTLCRYCVLVTLK